MDNPFEALLNFDVPDLSVSDAAETVVDRVTDIDIPSQDFENPLDGSLELDTPETGVRDSIEGVTEAIGDLTLPKLGLADNFGEFNFGDFGDANFGDSNFGETNFGDSNLGDSNFRDSNFGDSYFGDSNFGDSNFGFQETFDNFGSAITDVASSFADRVAPDFSLPDYTFSPSSYFMGFNNDNSGSSDSSYVGSDDGSHEEE